jgi:hypothetical protein
LIAPEEGKMDWVGAATAGAAGVAAILSGVNLYISGRQEMDKWTRESLVDILALFLDASFKEAGACRSILRLSPDEKEVKRVRAAILAAHDVQNEQLTRLRLLAPPSVVEAAQRLKESGYYLAEPCFLSMNPEDVSDVLTPPVWQCRAQFIEAARSALGIRSAAGTGSFEANVEWRILRSTPDKSGDVAE